MLTWFVVVVWALVVVFAVAAVEDTICRRIWASSAPPMPYRVFRAFARRRGRMVEHGPSEDERTRFGSHLLHLHDPSVARASRWLRATRALGLLAFGLCWPIRAMLPP